LENVNQMPVCSWVIRVPILVVAGDLSVVDQPREDELIRFRRIIIRNPVNIVVSANQVEFFLFLRIDNGSNRCKKKNQEDHSFHDEFLQAAGTRSSKQGWLAMYRLPRFDQAFRHT